MAIRATDDYGLEHSARTWSLSAALWRRRMSCLASSMVSTYRSLVDTILANRPASIKIGWPDAYRISADWRGRTANSKQPVQR